MQLNPIQEAIANSHAGPVLAIAVAGSGKTTAIVENIKNKAKLGLDMNRVVVMAFNKDAATRIKDRSRGIVPMTTPIGTCHSIFLRILRRSFQWPDKIAPDWTIKNICSSLLKNKYEEGDEAIFSRLIGNAKANLGTTRRRDGMEIVEETSNKIRNFKGLDYTPEEFIAVMEEYESHCENNFLFDFDDILLWSYYYLNENEDKLSHYQDYFTHLIIDEYQDTNLVQQELYQMLARKRENILCVGDDDQSIYSFRGGSCDHILNFQDTWPDAQTYILEENYRSRQEILNAANTLIHNNTERYYKFNNCTRGDGGKVAILPRFEKDTDEASYVCGMIKDFEPDGVQYEDICILTRTNAQQGPLEDALTNLGIPFRVNGGVSFYERPEINLCIAYAKVAGGLEHESLLPYLANRPNRFIKKDFYSKFRTLDDVRPPLLGNKGIIQFRADLDRNEIAFKRYPLSLGDYFEWLISPEGLNLHAHFRGAIADESANESQAQKNLQQLVSMTKDKTLAILLDQQRRQKQLMERNQDGKGVLISTVHKAKGLEWNIVFIVGANADLLPNPRSDEEEERRLMYVAVTRAKEQLYVSSFGPEASKFIDEISVRSPHVVTH